MGSHIQLGGTIAVRHENSVVNERALPGRQARLAFTYLVLERRRPVGHRDLADELWPEGPPRTWQAALRTVVSRVRGFLDQAGFDGAEILTGEAGRYELRLPDDVTVDLEVALGQLRCAEEAFGDGRTDDAREHASAARTVLVQPLLPGVDSPFTDGWRRRLATALSRCLEVLGVCRLEAGEITDAVAVLTEAVSLDPLHEPAWRGLMRAHALAGNNAKALEAYEELRRTLADELGADPSPDTQELHGELLAQRVRPRPAKGAPEDRAVVAGASPYRGLAAFSEADAQVFFGREAETRELLDRLADHGFVAVTGPSGSGKSSLVRAGLLASLGHGALPDSDTWVRIVMRPGQHPIEALALALAALGPRASETVDLTALRSDPDGLHDFAVAILGDHAERRRLLLVIDQFEETFTHTADGSERTQFIELVVRAATRPDALTRVVLTMRSDFVGEAARHLRLAEVLNRSSYVVGPLDPEGLERAIEGPAASAGASFEPGLTARILTDVTGQTSALPSLQHALLELWQRVSASGQLTSAAYEEIGGVEGAVASRAETTFASFDEDHRVIARRVLLRLTDLGSDSVVTRRRVPMRELDGVGPPEAVQMVVDALVDARLLTATSDASTARVLEFAHEALVTAWPRLARWIEEDRDGLRLQRRLTVAATEWDGGGRDADLLWRGASLLRARDRAGALPDELTDLERDFLEASRDREERAERRQRVRQRLLLAGVAVAALVFAGLAWLAQHHRDLARSRELAAQATNTLRSDPAAALALALDAYETAPTPQAEAAIRTAHADNALYWRSPDLDAYVVPVNPGDTELVAYGNSVVALLDADTGEVRHQREVGDEVGAASLYWAARAADGRTVVSTWDEDIGTLVYDAELGDQLARLPYTLSTAWTPDDRYLVGFRFGAGLFVADGDTYEVLYTRPGEEFLTHPGGARSAVAQRGSFTDDGLMITTEPGEPSRVHVVDLATGDDVRAFETAPLEGVAAFAPDGGRFAIEVGGELVAHEVDGWQVAQRWQLEDDVIDLEWLDDDRLVTLNASGTVSVRDVLRGTVTNLTGLEQAKTLRVLDGGLVLGIGGRQAILWDSGTGARLQRIVAPELATVDAWQVGVTERFLLVGDGSVSAYRLTTEVAIERPLRAAGVGLYGPYYEHLSDDALAALTLDLPTSHLQVLDVDDLEVRGEVEVALTRGGLAVAADGERLATVAPDEPHTLTVYDRELAELERWTVADEIETYCDRDQCDVTDLAFGPDGRLAVAVAGGAVLVLDDRGRVHHEFAAPGSQVAGLTRIAFIAADTIVRGVEGEAPTLTRLDLRSGRTVSLDGVDSSVRHLVHDAETGRFAVGDAEQRVHVFDHAGDRPSHTIDTGSAVRWVDFASGGLLVASTDRAELWDLRSGRPVASFGGNATELRGALWLDGNRAVTLGVGGDVRVHPCRACGPIEQVIEAARGSFERDRALADAVRD